LFHAKKQDPRIGETICRFMPERSSSITRKILNLFSRGNRKAESLDYLCLYSGADCELLTKEPKRRSSISEQRNKDGTAKRYRLDVLSSSSDSGGKVSETTSGEANFSSRFSRIILKNFPAKVFRQLGRAFRRAPREAALKEETALWAGIKEYLNSRNFFEFVCTEEYDKRTGCVANKTRIGTRGKTHAV